MTNRRATATIPIFRVAAASVPAQQSAGARAWKLAGTAALAAISLAWPATQSFRRGTPEPVVTRLDVVTPPSPDPFTLSLASDGRRLVFIASSRAQLWVRSLGEATARPLPGTEGGSFPFWSPDGRAIGFFADGKLKVVDLAESTARVIADAPLGRGGSWNRDGSIVFAPSSTGTLMRVSAAGGPSAAVTKLAIGQVSRRWPRFLPDGHRFLFFSAQGRPEVRGVHVGSLDGGEPARVLTAESAAESLAAGLPHGGVPKESRRLPLRPHAGRCKWRPDAGCTVGRNTGWNVPRCLSVSATGVLAHRSGGEPRQRIVWADRAGKMLNAFGEEAFQTQP